MEKQFRFYFKIVLNGNEKCKSFLAKTWEDLKEKSQKYFDSIDCVIIPLGYHKKDSQLSLLGNLINLHPNHKWAKWLI